MFINLQTKTFCIILLYVYIYVIIDSNKIEFSYYINIYIYINWHSMYDIILNIFKIIKYNIFTNLK